MTDAEPLTRQRRMLILGICCMSLFLVAIDNTIVNVALPAIRADLHASPSGLQWTVDAYTLVLASLMLLAGSSADRLGRARTFQCGLLLFSIGSAACSLAPTVEWLVAFRALQALGGCMLNPVAMSIIRNVFEDPRERAQAIGVWGSVVGLSLALGPVIGGALVDSAGWRWIFLVNVPVGLLAIGLTARYVPESRAPHARRIDVPGQILVFLGLATLVVAIIEGPSRGWLSGSIVALFVVSAVCAVALIVVESRRPEPLIDMRFFGSAPFTGATVIAVVTFTGFGGYLFLNSLYLQDVRGLSALDAGLYTLPMALAAFVLGPVSGRIVGTRGARLPLFTGGLCMAVSALMLTGLAADTSPAMLIGAYVIFGVGTGCINPPITVTAVSGMPSAQAGVAAAVASTSRQIGQTFGVAIIGAVTTSTIHGSLATHLAQASHGGWWIAAGCGAVVCVVAVVSTTPWARATAARTAERLDPQPVAQPA